MEAQQSEQPTPSTSTSTSNHNNTNDQTQPPPSPSSLDPRIHFDKTNNRWQFEADDGKEYEWIESKEAWVPLVDESLWSAQQAAYNLHGHPDDQINSDLGSDLPKDKEQIKLERKLKRQQATAQRKEKQKRGLDSEDGSGRKHEPVRNTAIYVSRLPLDVTIDEIHETFSKAGLVLVDEDNRPKIKLYEDESTGSFNGSALIVYLKVESVELAIRLFDESSLRIGESEMMKVSRAQFSEKKSNPNSMNESKKKKQKFAKKVDQLKSKLEEWDSEDEGSAKKDSRTVVLKYMFTVQELAQDPSLLIDLKEDVREECELLGNVTNVTLYDLEEEGIMTVKFKEPIAAQACILKMNHRFFAGRQVQAMIDDRSRRFKKSNHHQPNEKDGEGDEDEKKRLDGFAKYLESAE